ncbi:DUF4382 domain-containing protein, partial [Fulvivirga sp. RKSG066]|uniref:DUF4382 domain-containing protein n=1 Tax=Fulvivirga aurantia TaxID=2529383 RepID=UPI0012BB6724
KVDGKTFTGFSGKQTFDLMALQNGNTKVLGNGELDARTYSNITFVLDYEADANGNAPGCYVLTANNEKQKLESSAGSTGELVVNSAYEVKSSTQSRIVADFDLRKAIKYSNDNERKFEFVSDASLSNSVRVVNKNSTGSIDGNYTESMTGSTGKVVVFAYNKGSFNASTESEPSGEANIRFSNAVSSATVSNNGNYKLSFLNEGDYELHFASYEDNDQDGEYTFEAMLSSQTKVDGNVLEFITVEASSEVTVNTTITGIIN